MLKIILSACMYMHVVDSVATTQKTQPSITQFHSYTLGSYGEYSMRYKSIEANKPVEKTDTKTPIVCIHGFGGNADQFRKNLPAFAENGHDTYAIDLLGYGILYTYVFYSF
jgi:pimeloyl-ACP methyl ester carboxylesterase